MMSHTAQHFISMCIVRIFISCMVATTVLLVGQTSTPNVFRTKSVDQSIHEVSVDVVIIGAGWAGLAAAKSLVKGGVKSIRVLEARNRIGGRSWTTYGFGRDDVPVDLGSAWVHGSKSNPIQGVLDENDIPHSHVRDTEAVWDYKGHRLDQKRLRAINKNYKRFRSYMEKRQGSDDTDTNLKQVVEDFIQLRRIPDGVTGELGLRWKVDTEIAQEYAAPLSEMSLFWWDSDSDFGGGDEYLTIPKGGYTKVIEAFAAPVLAHIQLESEVVSIEYGKSLAKVKYRDGNNGWSITTILTKHVLLTLPLGVMKEGGVHFSPPLPLWKMEAIKELGYGLMNRCVLYWEGMRKEEIFWPHEQEWLMKVAPSGEQGNWTEFYNGYDMNEGTPLLIAFVVGEQAARMESLSDDVVTREAIASLREMFGAWSVPDPTGSIITRWGLDEFARGSYSFPKTGCRKSSHEVLAKEISKQLWFAGEATDSKFPSTTHGALISGERAAEKIRVELAVQNK